MAGEFERLIEEKKISETLGDKLLEDHGTFLILLNRNYDPRNYARQLKKQGTITGRYRTLSGPCKQLFYLLDERVVNYIVAEMPTIYAVLLTQRGEIDTIATVARRDLPKSLRIYPKSGIFCPI